jgi:hypothetical protein
MSTDATLAAAIGDVMREALASRDAQIAALDKRVAQLESAPPAPRWLGVWRRDNHYAVGDLVTDRGGLWLACRASSARPGTPDSGYQLIVKSGSYGNGEDQQR